MPSSRFNNTRRNIIFSYIDTIITMLFSFISRNVILSVLGSQYLGLTSLFSSIFRVLSMADLGFSAAIIYNMYKPVAENDIELVCALLNYYKKIYNVVAVVIFSAGLIMAPLIPYLIKDSWPNNINIYLLYFLFLINTAVSYSFFAYKSALLNALQRLDLTKIAYTITDVIQYAMQIITLVVIKNFYLYVVCMIIGTISKNILAAFISNRRYPQYICKGEISQSLKNDIQQRVKGLLVCNISGRTYTTLDSIILSTFLGLTSVAIYNNYVTIYNGVALFIGLVRSSMQASVGNSVAVESIEKNYQDMLLWQFLFSVLATWCVTCLFSLYQPFMAFWMGNDLLLPLSNVILICLWFYIEVIQHSFYLYLGGNGFWWEMRWSYIASTISNLILNIVLGKLFGIAGIIFSTLFAAFIFGLIWQCQIIFKIYFKKSTKEFYIRLVYYFMISVFSASTAFLINNIFVNSNNLLSLIVRFFICTSISVCIQFLMYHRTEEYKKAKILIMLAVKK